MKNRKRTAIFKITSTMPTQASPGAGLICLRPSVGFEVQTYVCAPQSGQVLSKHIDDQISFLFYKSSSWLFSHKRFLRLRQMLDNLLLVVRFICEPRLRLPAVIICYGMVNSLGCVLLSWIFRAPVIISLHNITDVAVIRKSLLFRTLLMRAAEIWVCSRELEYEIQSICEKSVFYRSTGFDPQDFYVGDSSHRFANQTIIAVGSFKWKKNFAVLIDAFSIVRSRNPNAKLVFVGDGELRDSLVEHAARLGLGSSVVFRGVLGQTELARELNQSSVFALPSLAEGRPKVVAEALATGLPCVVSGACNCDDLVENAGISVGDVVTPESIAEALNFVLSCEDRWSEMSTVGVSQASKVTWDNIATQEQEHLRDFLGWH